MNKLTSGTNEMNEVLNSIVDQVDTSALAEVTESDFKQNILPTVLAVHSGGKVSLAPWINITGSISDGIKVVDDTTRELLFITPGIYTTSSLSVSGGFINMISDVADAQKLKLDTQHAFAKHLNADKAKLVLGDSASLQINWYSIFARYNYRMIKTERIDETGKVMDNTPIPEVKKLNKPVEELKPSLQWGDDELI